MEQWKTGFATLEVLIGMVLILVTISAALPLVAGGQAMLVTLQMRQEAIFKAGLFAEETRHGAVGGFGADDVRIPDGRFEKWRSGIPLSATRCARNIKTGVSWGMPERIFTVDSILRVADMKAALDLGGDCQGDMLPEVAGNPVVAGSVPASPGWRATGVDVLGGTAFVTATSLVATDPDFFIIAVSDPWNPAIISSLDTGPGLNAVDAVFEPETARITAYVANNDTRQQLQIIDVDAQNHFSSPAVVAALDLAPAPLGTNSEAISVSYHRGRVYVGTGYLPGVAQPRPELHVVGVSPGAAPRELFSYDVNHNINRISVDDSRVYLATSDDAGEAWVLDKVAGTGLNFAGKFDAAGGEDGESIFVIGDRLYLGRDRGASGRPDLYLLDIATTAGIVVESSRNMALSPGASRISGIFATGHFIFLATTANKEFQAILLETAASIPNPFHTQYLGQQASGIDMEGNAMYLSLMGSHLLAIIIFPP